jgi:recombination protein RecA
MAKSKEEKKGADAILEQLEKRYGLQRHALEDHIVVSTGSIQLDQAMGIGGTAVGKMIEIFGPESSGKSTITLHQMAEYQKAFPERKVALFDYEHAFDRKYAEALGVNVKELLIYQPDTQESGYDMIIELVKNKIVSCVVVDSQSAASPKAIIDGEMGDATIGLQARNNSKFCLKIKGLLDINNVTLFFISQTRDSIGGMGDPVTTTGGKAIRFYSDVRWKIWKMNDKNNELNKTTVDVVKNKLGNPFGQAKIDILWGVGFDKMGEVIDYASEFNIIKKGGAWYTLSESAKFQGMDALKEFLEDNPELFLEIKQKVMNKLNNIVEPIIEIQNVESQIQEAVH